MLVRVPRRPQVYCPFENGCSLASHLSLHEDLISIQYSLMPYIRVHVAYRKRKFGHGSRMAPSSRLLSAIYYSRWRILPSKTRATIGVELLAYLYSVGETTVPR